MNKSRARHATKVVTSGAESAKEYLKYLAECKFIHATVLRRRFCCGNTPFLVRNAIHFRIFWSRRCIFHELVEIIPTNEALLSTIVVLKNGLSTQFQPFLVIQQTVVRLKGQDCKQIFVFVELTTFEMINSPKRSIGPQGILTTACALKREAYFVFIRIKLKQPHTAYTYQ